MAASPVLNPALHQSLIARGFWRTHHAPEWTEYGDAESGPWMDYSPAMDVYSNAAEIVTVDACGVVDRERNDPMLNKWLGEMSGVDWTADDFVVRAWPEAWPCDMVEPEL